MVDDALADHVIDALDLFESWFYEFAVAVLARSVEPENNAAGQSIVEPRMPDSPWWQCWQCHVDNDWAHTVCDTCGEPRRMNPDTHAPH